MTRTGPAAIFSPTLRPVTSTSAARLEVIGLEDVAILPRLHGLGPRLDDEQFAGAAVLGPFDVHRRPAPALGGVVVFDDAGPARELQDLVVGNGKARCGLGRARGRS